MSRPEPFQPGASIVWRSRPEGEIGYVLGCQVLVDAPDVIAVVQPTGAPISKRRGRRGGPRDRSMLPAPWIGERVFDFWTKPPSVRLHPVGRSYSVIRTWVDDNRCFRGWYVNLEQPWVRTVVGFDSRYDVLDVTAADDLSSCGLKDKDELDFAVEVGKLTRDESAAIRATAERTIDDIAARRWPFNERAWEALEPPPCNPAPAFPAGWDRTEPSWTTG